MKKRGTLYITGLVIFRSLVPSRPGKLPPGGAEWPLTVSPEEIPLYLADLGRAVGKGGRLALFFPGCRAPAAPFILFRLKREGFSDCRAIATPDGLLAEARR